MHGQRADEGLHLRVVQDRDLSRQTAVDHVVVSVLRRDRLRIAGVEIKRVIDDRAHRGDGAAVNAAGRADHAGERQISRGGVGGTGHARLDVAGRRAEAAQIAEVALQHVRVEALEFDAGFFEVRFADFEETRFDVDHHLLSRTQFGEQFVDQLMHFRTLHHDQTSAAFFDRGALFGGPAWGIDAAADHVRDGLVGGRGSGRLGQERIGRSGPAAAAALTLGADFDLEFGAWEIRRRLCQVAHVVDAHFDGRLQIRRLADEDGLILESVIQLRQLQNPFQRQIQIHVGDAQIDGRRGGREHLGIDNHGHVGEVAQEFDRVGQGRVNEFKRNFALQFLAQFGLPVLFGHFLSEGHF